MWWLVERAIPYLHANKLGRTIGKRDRLCNQEFQCREIKSQNLGLYEPVEIAVAGETPSLTGEFFGDTHRVLECMQAHPLGDQHWNGPI